MSNTALSILAHPDDAEFLCAGSLIRLGRERGWQVHIATMTPAAFGVRGCNPARQLSFLITEELTDTISLEDYCQRWREQPPALREKRRLIRALARISKTLHENGINHRDYYLCHFLKSPCLSRNHKTVRMHVAVTLVERVQPQRRTVYVALFYRRDYVSRPLPYHVHAGFPSHRESPPP